MPPLWRVFPWAPGAREGDPFSKTFVPAAQGGGRFDLPGRSAGVLYVAETPEHSVAEFIQSVRAPTLDPDDLERSGHRLSLVQLQISDEAATRIADLCDPQLLAGYGIKPDSLASRDRRTTQGIAQRLLEQDHFGLRWWSAYSGDWHGVVLFREVIPADAIEFGTPERLELDHPAVRDAAIALGIDIP